MSCFKTLPIILKNLTLFSFLTFPLVLYGNPAAEIYNMLIKPNVKPGRSALDIAMQSYPEAIEYLVNVIKVDVNETDEDQKTVLHKIDNTTQPRSVKKLIQLGANVNARDKYGRTPLHYQAEGFLNKDIIRVLVNNGADPNIEAYYKGQRPIDLVKFSVNRGPEYAEALQLLQPREQRASAGLKQAVQDPDFIRTCKNVLKLGRFF